MTSAVYPEPLGGSYEALSLNKTWMTADDRYGPYGYRDDAMDNQTRSHVDWDLVDWGALQDDCLSRNNRPIHHPRMSMPSLLERLNLGSLASARRQQQTGKSAIVVRTWETYKYKKEDMLFLRSLIVESCLSSGGKYSVFLLVDIKDRSRRIFSSTANYEAAIRDIVPPELQSIAVLFDESLLEQWYPKVKEHS